MQYPVASGVKFIVVSVKDCRALTGLTKDSGCCGVPKQVLAITLRFVIYLINNIHFYVSKVFFRSFSLGYHWSRVGARQHDLPCKSVEWLLHGVGFTER